MINANAREKARYLKRLARIERLRDKNMDYDIPGLDDEVFAQPLVHRPAMKETITIRVDADVLEWFKRQGKGYQTRINLVLRRYMDVAGQRVRPKTRARRQAPGRPRTSRRAR